MSKKSEKKFDESKNSEYNADEEIVVEEFSNNEVLKKLRDKLKKSTSEKQEYLNGWQRTKADFINYKKEEDNRKKEILKFAKEDFIEGILPVLDSFNMARGSVSWKSGLGQIYKQFVSILEKDGLEEVNPLDKDFNPNFHEVIEMTEGEEGKVVEVVAKGYLLNGKIIRPARVKVGK
ncbi:MAG TPA: nucleotide exchange factor GrpE [Candidatus Paceibacterota bacterium]|jgi:molecular chaperone GrpE|nr:nucleotide exchange factor GrpE [Parcubacteria group bacterium]MDP6119680.1 nucleotide exchange factor GrpE [Candidatus Paceibacterota bacterium]HJN62778.1 nucleotide exchange factor GrpE [Candidatus Paceibacterota bacterium]|tara:strand:- start:2108 stop:2638 length:531 start_codon:yes stop_codon:yes gene_type:complete